jgi:hypothetical protein
VNQLKTITIRSGTGTPQRTVEVVKKATLGFGATRSGGGRSINAVAIDFRGNFYETHPQRGWRPIDNDIRLRRAVMKLIEGDAS